MLKFHYIYFISYSLKDDIVIYFLTQKDAKSSQFSTFFKLILFETKFRIIFYISKRNI